MKSVWVTFLTTQARWGTELHNIKEAAQAAELFNIPAGYAVLQPRKKPAGLPKRSK